MINTLETYGLFMVEYAMFWYLIWRSEWEKSTHTRGPYIITWLNFKSNMDKLNKVWDEITYPFRNSNGTTGDVWHWISDSIHHFIMDVILYPCRG